MCDDEISDEGLVEKLIYQLGWKRSEKGLYFMLEHILVKGVNIIERYAVS